MRYSRNFEYNLSPILIIIVANLLLLLANLIYPKLTIILGLIPELFLSQPWTILTSLFMHSNIWHLFANMLTFFFFGRYLSRLIGNANLLIAYFIGGIIGNVLYLLLGDPLTILVGASGAVFALGGVLTIMRPKLKVIVFPIPIPIDLWIAVIGGFVLLSFMPSVAWQAHLGGFIVGLTAGYIFRKRERRTYFT